jgi:bacterioferritin
MPSAWFFVFFVISEAKRSEAEGVAKTETKNRDAEGMRSDRRERSNGPKAGRCASDTFANTKRGSGGVKLGGKMKGDARLITILNELLADEITAVNQYMMHSEMAEDWGYARLSSNFKTRAISEMRHAERLIERILFLDGRPIMSTLGELHIGATVPAQVNNDHESEVKTVKNYNDAMAFCEDIGDNATRDILKQILMEEDAHVDELEDLQDEIEQMGLQIFLSTQL